VAEDGPPGWGAPLHARVLDLAGVGAGTTVLDLGCGPGVFAAAAVAPGARVVGIDADRSAVAVASAAVPAADLRGGDAHDPPRGPFNVVAAVQVLQHVSNPLAVLRATARVGSTVAVTTWGPEEECDVRAFGEALAPWLPPRRPSGGPPPLTDPARLRKIVGLAGLAVAAEADVECPVTASGCSWPSPEVQESHIPVLHVQESGFPEPEGGMPQAPRWLARAVRVGTRMSASGSVAGGGFACGPRSSGRWT
jgi:SAM-dependent methyltransferase